MAGLVLEYVDVHLLEIKGAKIKPKTFKIGSKSIQKDIKKYEKRGLGAIWERSLEEVGSSSGAPVALRGFWSPFWRPKSIKNQYV